MIMNAYQTWEEFNKTGVDNILVYASQTVPVFIPFFLFVLFLIITMGTYYSTRKLGGEPDFFASATIGAFIVSITALLLTLKEGIINTYTLMVICIITTIMFVLLFWSKSR